MWLTIVQLPPDKKKCGGMSLRIILPAAPSIPSAAVKVEEQMVAERKARIAKEDEDSRREALRVQEELLAVCYVCDSGDHSEEDIVFCERCCVAVHTSCYQIVGVSVKVCLPRFSKSIDSRKSCSSCFRRWPQISIFSSANASPNG